MNDQTAKPTPQRIGKYDVVGVLGQGGMGVVYRARDSRIGRDVAIKTLTAGFSGESDMLKRFYQEAGHTGNLRHPNIVTVYDFGDEDGLPYIVMEFLDGEPLDKLIRQKAQLHLSAKLEIIEQVCAALAYAHLQGMIHRDVKPANVIVQREGLVKLLDFGIARADQQQVERGMTQTGTLVGTPAYMAPERLKGEPFDGRSDIFSTGVVLYELLAGVPPFDAEYPAILHQILQQDPPPLGKYLSSYPAQLDQVIGRALAKEPQDRYGNVGDMAADLNAIGAQLKVQRIVDLVAEARTFVDGENYAEAKRLLSQALRMDSQNADAKKLMAGVDQFFNLQKVRQRVQQLKKTAEESIKARNWDQAIASCAEALQLDPGNAEMSALMARATAGKQAQEQIKQLLREAESARHSGNFESAKELAEKASELDPADSRIVTICKVLEQEAEEARKAAKIRRLLQTAQESLAENLLDEASHALAEVEDLSSADAELLRLKDELAEAIQLEVRKRLVNDLQERAAVAMTLEQLRSAIGEVKVALEKFPTEPGLLRLKLQLDPRLREQENKRLIVEVSDACKTLSPTEALARIREALVRLPGNAELQRLESAITKRLSRDQREQILAEHMAKARALLEDHLYLETVKVLEQCEKEGFSSHEMTELLNMSRAAAAERISQDLVERSFLEAKRLLEQENYEEVSRLLEPVLQRVEEPGLRRQLEEAKVKQRSLEQRVEQLVAEVHSFCEMELFEAAIGLIQSEPAGVRQVKRVQAMLDYTRELLESEVAKLESFGAVYATLNGPECATAFQRIARGEGAARALVGASEIEKRLRTRVQLIADQKLRKCIESAKQALGAEDSELAESLVQSAAGWPASASAAVQAEWKTVESEIAAARKVLRFRKVLRR